MRDLSGAYVPFLLVAFASGASGAVGWSSWLIPFGAGLVMFAAVEMDKALRGRLSRVPSGTRRVVRAAE